MTNELSLLSLDDRILANRNTRKERAYKQGRLSHRTVPTKLTNERACGNCNLITPAWVKKCTHCSKVF